MTALSQAKKFFILSALTSGFFFLLGFGVKYYVPRLESWILIEIENQSRLHSPARVWPRDASIKIFPPRLVLSGVRLLPQEELAATLAPTEITEIDVTLNWLYLLTGRLRVSHIGLHGGDFKIILKNPSASKTHPRDPEILARAFRSALSIPIDEVVLDNQNFWLRDEENKVAFRLSGLKVSLESRSRSFLIDVDAPESEIKLAKASEHFFLSASFRALIEEKSIQLSAIKIKAADSFLVANARLDGGLKPDQWQKIQGVARLNLDLANIGLWEKIYRHPEIVPLNGVVKTDFDVSGTFQDPNVKVDLDAKHVHIDRYVVGDIKTQFTVANSILRAPLAELSQSAGQAEIRDLTLPLKEDGQISFAIKSKKIELAELLKNLKIPNLPFRIDVGGETHCTAFVSSNSELKCRAQMSTDQLHLWSPENKKTILKIKHASANGDFTVSQQKVTYSASIEAGTKSKGSSTGTIDYNQGFKIDYLGSVIDFADIENLSNLNLEGVTQLRGSTEGSSKVGRMQLTFEGKNIWLEDYSLGDPAGDLSYKEGILNFRNLVGQLGSTRYAGNLSINLPRTELFLQAKGSYVDLSDVQAAFGRRFALDLTPSGSGSLEVKAWGPLKFNNLNYQLKSSFFRGSILGETFDELTFDVSADKGLVKSDRVHLIKSGSQIDFTGDVNRQGVIESLLVARKVRLEESELVGRLKFDVNGQVDAVMHIRGQLPRPNFDLEGKLTQLVVGDRAAEDSQFQLKVSPEKMEGNGRLLGDIVTFDFLYPFTKNSPFKLTGRTLKWNFANLFSIFSNSTRQRDIQTALTSEIDLKSEGGFDQLNGNIHVRELKLQRGSVAISNPEAFDLDFQSGVIRSKPFQLSGQGGQVKVAVNEISKSSVQTSLNGKVDLSLATLFTPFLADLQGQLSLNFNTSGPPKNVQFGGSAYVERGLVRFREFPHPFTSIRADLLFAQQDLTINSLRADLAGGTVTGEGRIHLTPPNVGVQVKGQFGGVNFNVPEGYRTSGAGTWQMTGEGFPYTIGVNYSVEKGEVVAEFDSAGKNGRTVTPSALLPKIASQRSDQPIQLDLAVNMTNGVQVQNSTVRSLIRGKLQIQGPPSQLRFNGTLNPQPGGLIYFREVPFEVINGFIEYNDDPPENPKIHLSAQTQYKEVVRDEQNTTREVENLYEINLLAQGRAKQPPRISLSSLPPLSQKDIISLLALGMTSSALEANRTAGQLAASNSVQVGAAILQKPLGNEVRNRLGVDMQISQATSATDNSSVTKFTFNKQFTPKIGASYSRTIGKTPLNQVRLEYKFNKNLSAVSSWDGQEGTSQETQTDINPSIFGLDLEFKVKFK